MSLEVRPCQRIKLHMCCFEWNLQGRTCHGRQVMAPEKTLASFLENKHHLYYNRRDNLTMLNISQTTCFELRLRRRQATSEGHQA